MSKLKLQTFGRIALTTAGALIMIAPTVVLATGIADVFQRLAFHGMWLAFALVVFGIVCWVCAVGFGLCAAVDDIRATLWIYREMTSPSDNTLRSFVNAHKPRLVIVRGKPMSTNPKDMN